MLSLLIKDIQRAANPRKAKILQKFFKTAPGQYGAGDIFLGITVPRQRKIAQKYKQLKLNDLHKLLNSKIHEYRLTALLILIQQYKSSNQNQQKIIYHFYLNHTKQINNWDLVDLSAPKIIGHYLLNKNKKILQQLALSKNLWQKRIAIVATLEFIRHNQFSPTIKITHHLLKDQHELIHKAMGWMLREVGKRDQKLLEKFLKQYSKQLPRTTLRYAIEKFPVHKRKIYLKI